LSFASASLSTRRSSILSTSDSATLAIANAAPHSITSSCGTLRPNSRATRKSITSLTEPC
jgi:hypothetical protein